MAWVISLLVDVSVGVLVDQSERKWVLLADTVPETAVVGEWDGKLVRVAVDVCETQM